MPDDHTDPQLVNEVYAAVLTAGDPTKARRDGARLIAQRTGCTVDKAADAVDGLVVRAALSARALREGR